MATMSSFKLKHLLFLLVLLIACVLCSSHSETDYEARAPNRKPPPPRRSPPLPRRPPPPPRSPPPPPPRRPPPPPRSPPPPPPPPRSPSPPPPPPSGPKPGYDYFVLALSWPNGFCTEPSVTCRPSPPDQQYFTIHGLWPQKNSGGSPTDCQAPPVTDDILKALKTDLLKYWPRLYSAKDFDRSITLWKNQWSKHGSCSSNKFAPKDYFERGIALGEGYGEKILDCLKAGGINQDGTTKYSSSQVLEAIRKGTGKNALISRTTDKNGKLQLSEIRLCFESDAKTLKDCTENFIFASKPPYPPPPPRYSTTHTPFLELASSILEGEEATGAGL